eukprot:3289611-Alexandrium_andersonii.AAC.1
MSASLVGSEMCIRDRGLETSTRPPVTERSPCHSSHLTDFARADRRNVRSCAPAAPEPQTVPPPGAEAS